VRDRRWLPWVLVVAGFALVAMLGGRDDDTGEPLDPRSTGPAGARGLVLLLREYGADVSIGARPPATASTSDVALLLTDDIGDAQTRRLRAWVRRGGTLVVADPFSELVPALDRGSGSLFEGVDDSPQLERDCDLPSLRGVTRIEVPDALAYRLRPGAVGCFRRGEGAYLVARAEGQGTVVALAGGAPFTNEHLDDLDNAVLAVGLLAPQPGTSVSVLEPDAPGSGDEGLLDLVPRRLSAGLWQLVAAFGFVLLWRGRRLGRPVTEPQQVEIAGSELVVAVGNLLQHAGRRDEAAGMLQLQLRRDLAERLGLPFDSPAGHFAAALAPFGVDEAEVLAALSPSAVADDAALVTLARSIESLRREVTHA
jgi:hypothetical protein